MTTRSAITPEQAGRLAEWIEGLTPPFTITMKEGKMRTSPQNALLHKWIGEIAKQTYDSFDEVKRQCKFYQGCPILMADDPMFVGFISNLSHLTIEQKIASMDYVAVTSTMTTKQLGRMCDAIHLKYSKNGVRLSDPELHKYEAAA